MQSLKKIQHHQVEAFDLKQEISAEQLDLLNDILNSYAGTDQDKKGLAEQIIKEPSELDTPMVISVEKVLQLDTDGDTSISQQLSWLNKN